MIPQPSVALLGALAVLLFALEGVAPLRRRTRPRGARLGINLLVGAMAAGVALMTARPAALGLAEWLAVHGYGLLAVLPGPRWAGWVAGFVLMDLAMYWWHRANHRVAFLWRFHAVHHADPDLDVSTSFRFHFGEVALSTAVRVAQVLVIGVPVGLYLAHEAAFRAAAMFHHGNLRLPLGLERVLNLVLVTPRMHGIHHSEARAEADSNFSAVFRWWDRLWGTLRLDVPQARIRTGFAAYRAKEDNAFWNVALLPFFPPRAAGREGGRRSEDRRDVVIE